MSVPGDTDTTLSVMEPSPMEVESSATTDETPLALTSGGPGDEEANIEPGELTSPHNIT